MPRGLGPSDRHAPEPGRSRDVHSTARIDPKQAVGWVGNHSE